MAISAGQIMKIGTAETGSTFEAQGMALQNILSPYAPTLINPHFASIENAQNLERGLIDYGFMAANWIGLAQTGEKPFDRAIDLRLVAPMNAGPMFFIARTDQKLTDVRDLAGKRVAVGGKMSGIAQHARSLFHALGLDQNGVEQIYVDFETGADMLRHREVDAQLQCPIPNAVMSALDADLDLTVLRYDQAELERIRHHYAIYSTTIMRAGSLRALREDVIQPAVINVLVTHARQNTAEVEEVTRCIYRHRHDLPQLCALFGDMNALFEPARRLGRSALEYEGVRLHDGALNAYRREGLLI
jgi:TRAP transporter TAXI family solute receptor